MGTSFDSLLNKTVTLNKKVPVRVNYTLSGKRGEKNIDAKDKNLIENTNLYKLNLNLYTNKLPFGEKTKAIKSSNHIEYLHHFFHLRNFILNNRVSDLSGKDIYLQSWLTSIIQNSSSMYKFRLDRKGGILNGTFFYPIIKY